MLNPATPTFLNSYSALKRNLYFLSYSTEERDFVNRELGEEFNLIHLYYDLHHSYQSLDGIETIMAQLAEIIRNDHEALVLGHSFNGYLAYQLACLHPQLSHCILIDTENTFDTLNTARPNRLYALASKLYRQVIRNKDYGYPLSLVRHLYRDISIPKKDYDISIRKGAAHFYEHLTNRPAINDCIFVQATRSCMSNVNHGPNWAAYVKGKFTLVPVASDHTEIKIHHVAIAREIIRIVRKSGCHPVASAYSKSA